MSTLDRVLTEIGEDYRGDISNDSRYYIEVDIGKKAAELGFPELEEAYNDVFAIVPLREPARGMTVRIDGRTFVNYARLESGIAVPGYVAKDVTLPYEHYEANHSMILCFN